MLHLLEPNGVLGAGILRYVVVTLQRRKTSFLFLLADFWVGDSPDINRYL